MKNNGQEEKKEIFASSNETFAYIAGCTPAGFPYGITWEERNEESPYFDDIDGLLERRDKVD